MIASASVDGKEMTGIVPEIMNGTGPFGADEVRKLEEALVWGQCAELRLASNALQAEIDAGEKGKGKLLRAGIALYLLGDHANAEPILTKVSGDGLADFYHGQVLLALGRNLEASNAFEHAAKHGYDSVQCLLHRAGAVRAVGHIDQAEELLKTAASSGGGTRAEYCYQMGCILADQGDTYGAVEYFERAVDMNANHQKALFWLAGINASRGNDDDAIRLYERALARPPLHMGALINLGLLYEDTENYSAAAFCFKRVLDVYPDHQRAMMYLNDIESAHDMYYDEETLRNQARLKQILEIPVTDFELSVRSRNCLQKMGVRNLGDLTRLSEQELLGGQELRRNVTPRNQRDDGVEGAAPGPVRDEREAPRLRLPGKPQPAAAGAAQPARRRPQPVGAGAKVHVASGDHHAGRADLAESRRIAGEQELRRDLAQRSPRQADRSGTAAA